MKQALIIYFSATLALSTPAFAQTARVAEATDLPIEKRLEQDMIKMPDMAQALSKNLGQLHFLRTICFGKTDQTWRGHATKMMDIEAPNNSEDRRKLIKAFNDGYYDQQSRFNRCDENVSKDAAAIAENARQISGMLGDPYRE